MAKENEILNMINIIIHIYSIILRNNSKLDCFGVFQFMFFIPDHFTPSVGMKEIYSYLANFIVISISFTFGTWMFLFYFSILRFS